MVASANEGIEGKEEDTVSAMNKYIADMQRKDAAKGESSRILLVIESF